MAGLKLVFPCDHCNREAIEISDGKLKVTHRHDKEQHQTVIVLPQAVLTKLLESDNKEASE